MIHKGVGYRCSVLDSNIFEIWKSDRAKWTGENPYEAWVQVDKQFNENPLMAFGIDCPLVQYEYIRQLENDLPEGYMLPRINFYQTETQTNKKKRSTKAHGNNDTESGGRKGKTKKKQQKRKPHNKRKDDDSESDSDPESDDNFDYSEQ